MGVKAEPSRAGSTAKRALCSGVDVADESVGGLDVGYAGEREFLGQPVLKRPERPLRSPSRLGGAPVSRG